MNGINRKTGKTLKGHAHLRQSITDILTTPLGSRVMRRDYGSRLFELVDAPLNTDTLAEIYAATAEALETWEPRINVTKINATRISCGHVSIDLTGEYLPNGKKIKLKEIVA